MSRKLYWDPRKGLSNFFFKKLFGGHESFCGATDTAVLDFWWYLSCVSKTGWIPRLRALSPVCNEFLRFTSGATPADLLAASMAAGHIPYMPVVCWDSIGRPPAQWVDVLSTQLCDQLRFIKNVYRLLLNLSCRLQIKFIGKIAQMYSFLCENVR